jgi:L-serine dehydratase
MAVSVFELFKIGIGPSSSHTVGPMRAAYTFVQGLIDHDLQEQTRGVKVCLFGSLAFTGRGHGTDKAVILGLSGELPDLIDPDSIDNILEQVGHNGCIRLAGRYRVDFDSRSDLLFNKKETLPYHSNGMRFAALGADREVLFERDYYSVGGGFVVNQDEAASDRIVKDSTRLPYPFESGDELLGLCKQHDLSIADIMLANELAWRSETEIRDGLFNIRDAMQRCIRRGYHRHGVLPGGPLYPPRLSPPRCTTRWSQGAKTRTGNISRTESTQARQPERPAACH